MLLYAVTIFLSAFLLFQVQLVIAKYLLPWFGGTPAVWTTCMLFFQVVLVGGYAYAHGLTGRIRPRRQGSLHLAVLVGSLCLLAGQWLLWQSPILPGASWKPVDGAMPVLRILSVLGVSIGLPFFVLSSTSSLMQAWFSRTHPGRSPYRLYSLSNAGSLLGLLSYPFLVEPGLTLRAQAWTWTGCFAAFAFCCAGCALRVRRHGEEPAPADDCPEPAAAGDADPPRIGWRRRLGWLVLPAIASVLLLATTNKISQEVAVFPFLWVLPLALYLLSFILCFASRWLYGRAVFAPLALAAWVVLACLTTTFIAELAGSRDAGDTPVSMAYVFFDNVGVVWVTAAYMLALFFSCMLCHGELFRLKPPASQLTSYYLTISVGGALGGVLVAVVAPLVFNGLWELHIGYAAVAAAVLSLSCAYRGAGWMRSLLNSSLQWVVCTALIVTVAMTVWEIGAAHTGAVAVRRNFYGVLRVKEENADDPNWRLYSLCYAGTEHGYQYRHEDSRRITTTYYTEASGVGLAIKNHPRRRRGRMRIGVVGLGTGTIAAYGRRGDRVRFYEINPAIVDLAHEYFTFLNDSRAEIDEIVMGDARISLERELREGKAEGFDVLAIDAFSGDAIPVHLLTLEAFIVYLGHLGADGVLAVHISNRYLDLAPVVWRLADEIGLHCAQIDSPEDSENDAYEATWMLLSLDAALLEPEPIVDAATPRDDDAEPAPLWTDDYSNLFNALGREQFRIFMDDEEPADSEEQDEDSEDVGNDQEDDEGDQ